jgi:hypothetical protein
MQLLRPPINVLGWIIIALAALLVIYAIRRTAGRK